ncbi:hypothetical protein [Streptomyces sp. NPDC014734]|uniref:hypothetical protein n=1 Tax=Streptomyces sp. NPDC014734 TaxID=3364886 RepID=UPI0036FA50C7
MVNMPKGRTGLRALLVAAAVGAMTGTVAAAPAQAADSCNSTRVCFYQRDGTIKNIDPDAFFPKCSTGAVQYGSGIDKAYNRSNRALSVYAENGATLSRLDPGETIKYTPSAVYGFCIWGL